MGILYKSVPENLYTVCRYYIKITNVVNLDPLGLRV